MKLITNIRPRSNGKVVARGADGVAWVFEADESGALVCDVTDKATIGRLLAQNDGQDYEPADEADYTEAERLLPRDDDDSGDDEVVMSDPGSYDEMPLGGLPLEANTPARPRKAKGAAKA